MATPIRGPVGVASQPPNHKQRLPQGVAVAIRGAVAPQGVLEDSLVPTSTTKQGGQADRSDQREDSGTVDSNAPGPHRTPSGAYLGLDREAVILQSTEHPEASVVVLDRTLDPHTGIVVGEAVPVLSQSEADSQMQEAVSKAQKAKSNPGSEPQASAEGEADTPREGTPPADTPQDRPQSRQSPTSSTGSTSRDSTNPKPQG